jgi:hypothetical protein
VHVYHGTTSDVLDKILRGSQAAQRRVFTESNVSLGGTYVTARRALADVYAQTAARELGGLPVVLELDVDPKELLPDEDWPVRLFEVDESAVTPREQKFLDDLFVDYPGEGFSLSDHYTTKYEDLNRRHRVSWRDSWKWMETARLDRPLKKDDLLTTR